MGGKRGASPGQVDRGKSGHRNLAAYIRPPLNKIMGASGGPAWGKSGASRPGQVRLPEFGRRGPTGPSEIMRTPYSRSCLGNDGGKWGASRATGIWPNTSDRPFQNHENPLQQKLFGELWGQVGGQCGASPWQVRGKSGASLGNRILAVAVRPPLPRS